MMDPQTTRQNYERLKAPKKYLEIPYGHWSQQPEYVGQPSLMQEPNRILGPA